MHVLVADDDRIAAAVLAQTLTRWNFDVTVVGDGAQAWARLHDTSLPTLAILDWMMPELDGTEVCRRIRQQRPLANLYLMLLTSLESRSHVVAGLEAGADDYLVKPFDPDELRARVNVGVRVLTLQETLAQRVDELQAALDSVKQLHGLLPICSYCKRIRGDDQYWQQVESYIVERSDAQFSHSICPACYVEAEKEIEAHRRNSSGSKGA
jgi:sigma-B regulation protein RsbU (phosphoserine phosphatase)